jgi:hypothetical protein
VLTRESLLAEWLRRQQEYQVSDARIDGAKAYARVIAEIETCWRHETEAEVDLVRAAEISGYSTDHLRRLRRQGKLPSVQRGGTRHFRTGDLPRKAAALATLTAHEYDEIADARRVAARRNGGG